MDLKGAVPGGGQVRLLMERQLKQEVGNLILGVVCEGEIIGKGLIIMLGQPFILKIEHLGPGAVSGRGADSNALRLRALL